MIKYGSALDQAHNGEVNCVAFSHDGNMIATGGNDCIVKLWNAESLTEIPSMRKSEVIRQELKRKGHKNIDKEKVKKEDLYQKFTKPVTAVAFSYLNDYLAGCSEDLSIKVWCIDRIECKLVRTMAGHTGNINACRYLIGSSFIEPLLITGASDRTIKFWEQSSGTYSSLN